MFISDKDINYSLFISYLIVGMPNMPYLYAMDFIDVLKKKHASGSYKEMVKNSFLYYIMTGNDATLLMVSY